MWALDTSWLIALFNGADVHHREAMAQAQEPGPLLVDQLVIAEFLDGVHLRAGREATLEVLAEILKVPQLRLVAAPKAGRIKEVFARGAGLSWYDASAICTAVDEGAGLRTFDKDQKRAFAALG